MVRATDFMMIAAVGILGYFGYQAIKNLTDMAQSAGKTVRQVYEVTTTSGQSWIEGTGNPTIPETPEGYLPSNWMYEAGGVTWGVPAGMTPVEFCAQTGWQTDACKAIRPWWHIW